MASGLFKGCYQKAQDHGQLHGGSKLGIVTGSLQVQGFLKEPWFLLHQHHHMRQVLAASLFNSPAH